MKPSFLPALAHLALAALLQAQSTDSATAVTKPGRNSYWESPFAFRIAFNSITSKWENRSDIAKFKI